MEKIAIDFQGGAHGNYLEFVCNKFLAGIKCADTPFNSLGASHAQKYQERKIFVAGHYTYDNNVPPSDKLISIVLEYNDLLPLTAISLLRAGDYGYDNQFLENDTYHKLNNKDYRWVLDNIIDKFFKNQIKESYDSVRDPTWPEVDTLKDYEDLPAWIKQECQDVHKLKLLEINENQPHCPRNILREFFKISFLIPEKSGFWMQQQKIKYPNHFTVTFFPFDCFYSKERFILQIETIGEKFGYKIADKDRLAGLHDQFLQKQPYKNLKQDTDAMFNMIIDNIFINFDNLNMLQEAYLDAKCEIYYNKHAPTDNVKWFQNSVELKKYYESF